MVGGAGGGAPPARGEGGASSTCCCDAVVAAAAALLPSGAVLKKPSLVLHSLMVTVMVFAVTSVMKISSARGLRWYQYEGSGATNTCIMLLLRSHLGNDIVTRAEAQKIQILIIY